MAGIFAATTALAKILTAIKNGDPDDLNSILTESGRAIQLARIDGSITKLLGKYIVEPVIIISKDARNTEIADKIINLNTDIFCSFYLQAFNVLMNMYRIESTMAVDLLSSDSQSLPITALKKGAQLVLEGNVDYYGNLLNNKYLTVSTEAEIRSEDLRKHQYGYKSNKVGDIVGESLYFINTRELNITIDGACAQTDRDNNIHTRKQTFSIPITVKAHVIATPMENILNMLKPNDRTKTFGYRLDEWKSGAISLKDLIFCGDLIDKYKKNKLKDKDGLLSIIKSREESANAKALGGNMIGFEKFYNMLIVTADEKVLLNKHLGGSIDNEKYKQELLTEAHALTLSVLDEDYERAYILTKDIRGRSDVTYKALLKKSDKSTDAADIVKALMMNKAPAF